MFYDTLGLHVGGADQLSKDHVMRLWIATAAALSLFGSPIASAAPAAAPSARAAHRYQAAEKPTILLVHGAFAGSSSWNAVITDLTSDGYSVIAVANPLRSLRGDAAYVASIVNSISGPVVLVGHSYGGEVISVAAVGHANVRSLVFVAGVAPDIGESAASLGNEFPTGTLGKALAPPVALPDGGQDIYIDQARYWQQFAADVPKSEAVQMAATQRPVIDTALAEPAVAQSWRSLPSWFIWGSLDRNIPAALHAYMAKRAGARAAIEIKGASHVVMISHHRAVANLIERAAAN